MKYKNFEKLITDLQKKSEVLTSLHTLGVDLLEYDELNQRSITALLEEAFGAEGAGWIDWYLYERVSPTGKTLEATDKHGKRICHNVRSLWETVEKK